MRRAYYKRRSYYAMAGLTISLFSIFLVTRYVDLSPPTPPQKMDSARKDDPLVALGRERKLVVQKLGEEPEEVVEQVQTGTSSVPTFPRYLPWGDREGEEDEYQLMGLGIRTVSFLGIEVYVVGLYIATSDIAALQSYLVQTIAAGASTLVAGERDELRKLLLDPVQGEETWSKVLKQSGIKTIVRIVPTRNTDFGHLRDAFVRHLTARSQRDRAVPGAEYNDEAFGIAVGEFKKLFNRGSVPKGKELLMARDGKGKLVVWYDDGKLGSQRVGEVTDERISRVLWLQYLAGKTVSSEQARVNIIEGIMEYVERPVGTVEAQVHV